MNSSITLLSPTPRNAKHGWYDLFQKHNLFSNKSKSKMLIVGVSLVSDLSKGLKFWYCWRQGTILLMESK